MVAFYSYETIIEVLVSWEDYPRGGLQQQQRCCWLDEAGTMTAQG
jgi:hypothetical protein